MMELRIVTNTPLIVRLMFHNVRCRMLFHVQSQDDAPFAHPHEPFDDRPQLITGNDVLI